MLAATITFAIKTITIITTITTITEIETTGTEVEEEAVTESSEETTDEMTDFVMTEERTAVGTDGQCSPLTCTPFSPTHPYLYFPFSCSPSPILPPFLLACIPFPYSHIHLPSFIFAYWTSAVLHANWLYFFCTSRVSHLVRTPVFHTLIFFA